MELTTVISICCFLLAIPQSLAAIAFLWDWIAGGKSPKAKISLFRKILAVVLVVLAVATGVLGTWLLSHPLKPVEKVVYVDKPVPCPPSKTGDVKVDGKGNVGNSGNDAHINDPADKK